jgi:XTP/dITP diphosphohydrolase
LEETNKKFIKRFNYIEEHSLKIGKPLKEMTLGEMDALWNEAKMNE